MISFPSLCLGNLLVSAPRAHWGNDWSVGGLWGRNPQGGGWGMLFWSPQRQWLWCGERGVRAASPLPLLCAPLNSGALLLWWDGLLPWTPLVMAVPHASPFALSLSSQLISPGLSSRPQVSAPGPYLCQWMCVSGWDTQGGGPDGPRGSRSVLPATNRLLHFPLSRWSLSPHWLRELSRAWEIYICPALSQGYKSCPASSFFFFSFTRPGYVKIFIILPGVWGLLLVFSRCLLTIVPLVDVFLMWLWEEVCFTFFYSTILTGTLSFILDFTK